MRIQKERGGEVGVGVMPMNQWFIYNVLPGLTT